MAAIRGVRHEYREKRAGRRVVIGQPKSREPFEIWCDGKAAPFDNRRTSASKQSPIFSRGCLKFQVSQSAKSII
jgi:hypothetical protein